MIQFIASGVGGLAFSPFVQAISTLYSVGKGLNEFLDEHIESLKNSNNATVSKVGDVLEGAKFGFGLGYLSSVTIMAAGQLLLGNTLAAVGQVATAATIANPIAMTCASVGAIYFGWNALSEEERNSIIKKLEDGLKIGVEMIRAILEYVIKLFKTASDSKIIAELRKYVGESVKLFGRTLSDVTRRISDKIFDATEVLVDVTAVIANKTSEAGGKIVDVVQDAGGAVLVVAKKGIADVKRKTK